MPTHDKPELPEFARLEARLAERSAIIDGALDGIVVIDDDGIVQEFNKAAEAMFGYARDEAVGTRIADLIIPDHHRGNHEAGFSRYVTGTGAARMIGRRIETEARRKCGDIFPVELTIIETAGTDRQVFAGYLRDLTERRAMEKEVARQRERASQSEKLGSMGSLLANVAHELNNPLSVVIGRAELLREQPLDDAVKRHTDRILTAANRCAGIVRTFLAAVRQKPPARNAFPAARPLAASLDLVEHAYASDGIALQIDISDALPDLFGDEGQIGQVLANLLTNAQQALGAIPPPKKVRAGVRHDPRENAVVYTVADNGPGVPEDLQARIFEPFFTTKPEGSGTGVGLAIAHNIVTAHGGALQVGTHEALGGALFEITVPVTRATDDADASQRSDAASEAPPSVPLNVLVVDDDAECAAIIGELVTLQGMRSDIAHSASQAIARLESGSYDMILTDLRMPDMGGPELYGFAADRWPGIEKRFGFITGDNLNAAVARFLKEVDAPVMEKPVTGKGVRALVSAIRARTSP